LFSCGKEITLSVDDLSVTVKVGETYQIDVDTNDDLVLFESSDESVLTISDSGLVSALKVGNASVKVVSKADDNVFVTISVTVENNIEITTSINTYTIKVGESVEVAYSANDDVTLTSSDEAIFTVDGDMITGVEEGEATLTITADNDANVTQEITITVRKSIELSVDQSNVELWVGKTEQIIFTSNDNVEFVVADDQIATVTQDGLITGISNGLVNVEVISLYDQTVKEIISVRVYNPAETLIITGNQIVNINNMITLTADVGPDDAYEYVTWESSDDEIATINEDGELTAISSGMITVTATSIYDETLVDDIEIEVVNYLVVDATATTGTALTYMGLDLVYDIDLFSTISNAEASAVEGASIYVLAGTYQEDITISTANLIIDGTNQATIDGLINVASNQVKLMNFNFSGQAQVTNAAHVEGFEFIDNQVLNLTMNQNFIDLDTISDVAIHNNMFTNTTGVAISIENYLGGLIEVKNNTIDQASIAIRLIARDNYDSQTQVHIERNTISNVAIGLEIETLSANDIEDWVRFNSVSNYSNLAVKASEDHKVDFTLNYWGSEIPVYSDFENVTTHDLRGFYEDASDIVTEANYNPLVPLVIIPEADYLLIEVNDIYTLDFEVLPLGSDKDKVRYITEGLGFVSFKSYGVITGAKSGFENITLRLSNDFSINAQIQIEITTDPGVQVTPSITTQNLIVGDSLTLEATVFPYQIRDENVLYHSSDPLIASINQDGVINSYTAGTVTFTVSLEDDSEIYTEYQITFYDNLDEANILDALTMAQVNYATPHSWLVYGVTHNYLDFKYESVSRYYFDDLFINTSKIIPLGKNRPGYDHPSPVDGLPQYNDENIYYVVVHETANTSPGQGALAHANYIYSLALAGQVYTSWHFTMDDKEVYQHIPVDEIAYHAGDGSRVAGTFWGTDNVNIGGGNMNGIGIETSVADDGDNYRVWQRTAKLVAQILVEYNLPLNHMKYHNHFSGKMCPQSMLRGGLTPLFEELVEYEYLMETLYKDAIIEMSSDFPEYLDDAGRIIKHPERAMTVSYTVTVDLDGVVSSRTFYTYLPGTIQ
jgi:N-acetylmuramoyl-L-alanine amidase